MPGAIRAGIRIGCLAVFSVGVWNWILYLVALAFHKYGDGVRMVLYKNYSLLFHRLFLFCRWKKNELWVHCNIRPGGSEYIGIALELSASPVCRLFTSIFFYILCIMLVCQYFSATVFSLTFLDNEYISVYVGAAVSK